jgi:hypothetical protein
MWPWDRAYCPLDPSAKTWVEGRLDWLRVQFGDELFLRRPLILPTLEFFPELGDREQANLEGVFRRVCEYMQLERGRFQLEVVSKAGFIGLQDEHGHGVGEQIAHYQHLPQGEFVRVRERMIEGPFQMIAVLAHELSHARLPGEGRLDRRVLDNELVTDLTALYHGFGVFLARYPQSWISGLGRWPGTQRSMPKYMNAYMHAWALAHQAWLRDEQPHWFALLPSAVRAPAQAGLRYLQRTGDSAHRTEQWQPWIDLHDELSAPCSS